MQDFGKGVTHVVVGERNGFRVPRGQPIGELVPIEQIIRCNAGTVKYRDERGNVRSAKLLGRLCPE